MYVKNAYIFQILSYLLFRTQRFKIRLKSRNVTTDRSQSIHHEDKPFDSIIKSYSKLTAAIEET